MTSGLNNSSMDALRAELRKQCPPGGKILIGADPNPFAAVLVAGKIEKYLNLSPGQKETIIQCAPKPAAPFPGQLNYSPNASSQSSSLPSMRKIEVAPLNAERPGHTVEIVLPNQDVPLPTAPAAAVAAPATSGDHYTLRRGLSYLLHNYPKPTAGIAAAVALLAIRYYYLGHSLPTEGAAAVTKGFSELGQMGKPPARSNVVLNVLSQIPVDTAKSTLTEPPVDAAKKNLKPVTAKIAAFAQDRTREVGKAIKKMWRAHRPSEATVNTGEKILVRGAVAVISVAAFLDNRPYSTTGAKLLSPVLTMEFCSRAWNWISQNQSLSPHYRTVLKGAVLLAGLGGFVPAYNRMKNQIALPTIEEIIGLAFEGAERIDLAKESITNNLNAIYFHLSSPMRIIFATMAACNATRNINIRPKIEGALRTARDLKLFYEGNNAVQDGLAYLSPLLLRKLYWTLNSSATNGKYALSGAATIATLFALARPFFRMLPQPAANQPPVNNNPPANGAGAQPQVNNPAAGGGDQPPANNNPAADGVGAQAQVNNPAADGGNGQPQVNNPAADGGAGAQPPANPADDDDAQRQANPRPADGGIIELSTRNGVSIDPITRTGNSQSRGAFLNIILSPTLANYLRSNTQGAAQMQQYFIMQPRPASRNQLQDLNLPTLASSSATPRTTASELSSLGGSQATLTTRASPIMSSSSASPATATGTTPTTSASSTAPRTPTTPAQTNSAQGQPTAPATTTTAAPAQVVPADSSHLASRRSFLDRSEDEFRLTRTPFDGLYRLS